MPTDEIIIRVFIIVDNQFRDVNKEPDAKTQCGAGDAPPPWGTLCLERPHSPPGTSRPPQQPWDRPRRRPGLNPRRSTPANPRRRTALAGDRLRLQRSGHRVGERYRRLPRRHRRGIGGGRVWKNEKPLAGARGFFTSSIFLSLGGAPRRSRRRLRSSCEAYRAPLHGGWESRVLLDVLLCPGCREYYS